MDPELRGTPGSDTWWIDPELRGTPLALCRGRYASSGHVGGLSCWEGWWGPPNAISYYVNVYGVVALFGCGGVTSTLERRKGWKGREGARGPRSANESPDEKFTT